MTLLYRLLAGLALSALIGAGAYARGSLTKGGVAGAMLLGTTLFAFGGVGPGLLLVAFFVSSSLLSHYRRQQKEAVAEKFSKGERRDLAQALANGGLAALLALGRYAGPPALPWLAALVGALAAVNADTWATELGVLARGRPRLVTTLAAVEPGTSGAVSALGTTAALAGALFIATLAELFHGAPGLLEGASYQPGRLLLAGTLGGLAGSLFDSFLGATVQSIYYCDTCHKETERLVHTCGTPTRPMRGWRWLNNDLVNVGASLAGALVAALIAIV